MAAAHPLRRSGHRVARRLARSLGLCALIAAALVVAPVAATAAGIAVRVSGSERHLSPEQIEAAVDQPAGSYLLRARGTTAEPVAHPPALSMRRLVALAGGSPEALSFMTIERPNGTTAILRSSDLTDPPPFAEGPPIVWMDAGGVRYLRPLRGPSDANAADNIGITDGDLAVRVHQGPLLGVRARADRAKVAAGELVRLTAEVTGATPGKALSFEWTLGDGARKSGQAVRHRFRKPGVYEAVASVSGADDSGGSSAPVRIRVGKPPKGAGDLGGGAGDPRHSPAQGPVQGGGTGDAGRRAAPTATTPGSPSSEPPDSGKPSTTPDISKPPPTSGRSRRPPTEPGAPAGPVVRGTLVASRTAAPLAGATPAPVPARLGADTRSDGFALPAGILAVVGLLVLGGRRERRALRRHLGPGL